MSEQAGHRQPQLPELEPPPVDDRQLDNFRSPVQGFSQRRLHRLPDQLGTVPEDPFPRHRLRPHRQRQQSGARDPLRGGSDPPGLQPSLEALHLRRPRQVHRLLPPLQGRCHSKGREQSHRPDQREEICAVRRLESDGIQSGHQPQGCATFARRRDGRPEEKCLHVVQHNGRSEMLGVVE